MQTKQKARCCLSGTGEGGERRERRDERRGSPGGGEGFRFFLGGAEREVVKEEREEAKVDILGGRAEEGRVVREERLGRGGGERSKVETVFKEERAPRSGRDAATGQEKLRKRCWRAPSSRRGRSSKQLQRRGRAGIKAGVPTTTERHPKTATADTIETLPTTTRQSRRTCLPPSSCPPAPTNPRKKTNSFDR